MTEHRLEGPGENGDPVPRDLPDQQAGEGEDPWEAAPATARRKAEETEETDGTDDTGTDDTAPDDTTGPEDEPTPDEPTA
ncbi:MULTISPECIES: hypothetical protein [unclassified Streptomyces]|uniref:hypothetical protein n=1 Tax=unclassified Streptomyces TaxID=2593676 RepID=UPI0004C02670|nr:MULTISPECIES: hypothetical protein [unclassified Streptomyces]